MFLSGYTIGVNSIHDYLVSLSYLALPILDCYAEGKDASLLKDGEVVNIHEQKEAELENIKEKIKLAPQEGSIIRYLLHSH